MKRSLSILALVGTIFMLPSITYGYAHRIINSTPYQVKVRLTYAGQSEIACKPDNITIDAGKIGNADGGICLLKSASVEADVEDPTAKGSNKTSKIKGKRGYKSSVGVAGGQEFIVYTTTGNSGIELNICRSLHS